MGHSGLDGGAILPHLPFTGRRHLGGPSPIAHAWSSEGWGRAARGTNITPLLDAACTTDWLRRGPTLPTTGPAAKTHAGLSRWGSRTHPGESISSANLPLYSPSELILSSFLTDFESMFLLLL